MWKDGIEKPGRIINDFVSFIDFAPTFLSIAGIHPKDTKLRPIQGKSLTPIFRSTKEGIVNAENDHVIFGKERHDVGRPHEWGYPIRGIIQGGLLYLMNFEPARWPAGNPETGYLNCDGSPTKTIILEQNRANPGKNNYWNWDFGKRPKEEFYDIKEDPECLHNLIGDKEYAKKASALKNLLFTELKQQKDPRMFGNGSVFEKYPPTEGKDFYKHFMEGKKEKTGWVNASDYETDPRIINMQ
jgi:arylsulfatase A-like enzyme